MLRRMSRTVALGFLLLTSTASAGIIDNPILGGSATTVGQYPNVVALEVGGGLCTGTLITPDWVLTAAHCIQGLTPSSVRVHFGTVNMFSNPGVVRTATQVIAKPGFSENNLGKNDIGLIKLNMPITDIKPVPVNLDPAKAPVGLKVTMVGYGATAAGGGGSTGAQFMVEQTSVACASYVGSNTDLLCFSQTNGKGKCQGDSGGPSFAMVDGVFTQVGVTSFGDQYCQQFGADTRTDAEKEFLLMHVPQLECEYDTDCPGGAEGIASCFGRRCITAPFTEGGLGSECVGNAECDSGLCANDGDNQYCSMQCTPGNPASCPTGLECVDAGDGTGACWPADEGGCCDSSNKNARTGLMGLLVVGFVLSRKRRRK